MVARLLHLHGNGPVARSFAVLFLLGTPGSRLLTLAFDKTASGYAQSAVERSALRAVLLLVLCACTVLCKHCKELRACSFFVISMFLHHEKVLMSCVYLAYGRENHGQRRSAKRAAISIHG